MRNGERQALIHNKGSFSMNAKIVAKIGLGLITTVLCLAAGTVHAQATRTWVSGVGDDANPCSRTAPCKTFAGAISKTAAGGEINALDPGGYGVVTITKSITIDGGAGQVSGVLAAGTTGIIISAAPSDVVRLRNLDIAGVGTGVNGIRFIAGASLEIHNVHVYGFTNRGISFETPVGTTSTLTLTDSKIEDNAAGAVWLTGAGTSIASILRVTMVGGQRGVRAEDGAIVHVKDSTASHHISNGFVAVGTSRPVTMTIDGCAAFHNPTGGVFAGTLATIILSNSTIAHNGTGLVLSGGTIVSAGNNTVLGNTTNGAPSSTPGQI